MINTFLNLIRNNEIRINVPIPVIEPFSKHYNEMNRKERREYKRWLKKNQIWDGAVCVETALRNGSLTIGDCQ